MVGNALNIKAFILGKLRKTPFMIYNSSYRASILLTTLCLVCSWLWSSWVLTVIGMMSAMINIELE